MGPEIDMVVNKQGLVKATCKACGWRGKLDNSHKLATFISKNPPSSGVGFAEHTQDKPSREDRRSERATMQETNGDRDANSHQSQKEHKEEKPAAGAKDKDKDGGQDEAVQNKEFQERKSTKEVTRDRDEDECEDEHGEAQCTSSKTEQKEQKEQREQREQKERKEKKDKK